MNQGRRLHKFFRLHRIDALATHKLQCNQESESDSKALRIASLEYSQSLCPHSQCQMFHHHANNIG